MAVPRVSARVRCCCRSSGRRCHCWRPAHGSCAYVRRWSEIGEGGALAQLQLADGSGGAVVRIGGLRLREASEAQIREAARSEVQHLYRLDWRPVALNTAGPEAITLLVGGDGQLAKRLGLDWVDSVAAVVARLDQGEAAPARMVIRSFGGAGVECRGLFWPPRTLVPNVR